MKRDESLTRVSCSLYIALHRPIFDEGLPARDLLFYSEPWIALGSVAVFEIGGALIREAQARAASEDGSNQENEG